MSRGIGAVQQSILKFFEKRPAKWPVTEGILGLVVFDAKEMTRAQRLSLLRALKNLAAKAHPFGLLKNEHLQQYVIYRTDNKASRRTAEKLAQYQPSQLLSMELERIIPKPGQPRRIIPFPQTGN